MWKPGDDVIARRPSHLTLPKFADAGSGSPALPPVSLQRRSLRVATHTGSPRPPSACRYELLKDYNKAVEYHQKRLSIAQATGDREAEGRACCNLGNTLRAQGQYAQAIEYYKQDLSIAQELNDRAGEAISFSNLGSVHQAIGDYGAEAAGMIGNPTAAPPQR